MGLRVGTSYKQTEISGDYDVIFVGSGAGSLTAASLLARYEGLRVLVLERHYTAGGFTHAFQRPGYDWDVGVHYIGRVTHARSFLRRLFDDLTGGSLEWEDMGEVYDRIVIGDDVYDFAKGPEAFRERMVEYFPEERSAIDLYIETVYDAVRRSGLLLASKAVAPPVSWLAAPGLRMAAGRRILQTTRQVLDGITRNKRLQAVLTGQYGDYGLPPSMSAFMIHALVAHHYFDGGAYPVGGATQIAAGMTRVLEEHGGRVITNAEVERILTREGAAVGVRLAGGQELFAPQIVSGAGVAVTFGKLLDGYAELTQRIPPSVSHACLYVGLDRDDRSLDLPRANFWVYPSDDHDRSWSRAIEEGLEAPLAMGFISFPSAKDPDFQNRHPGHSTIEVATLLPWDTVARWDGTRWHKRGPEYDRVKESLTERLLELMYRRVPRAKGHVAHSELSTPLSTRHFAAHPHGEIYGLAHTPERFKQKWLGVQSPVKNLFLTGVDIVGCGVAGALMSGVVTASYMARRDLRKEIGTQN